MILRWILCAVIPYLLGSISFGILLTRHTGRDIRKEGSGNTGATNALRVFGFKTGMMTFLLDILKAAVAVIVGRLLLDENGAMLAGLCVVIGHNWPVFFGFKGGKGIACSSAVLVLCYPIPALIAIAVCLLAITLTRYVSLGSMLMLVCYAVIIACTKPLWPHTVWAVTLALLGIWRHRANIVRLIKGTESKISFRKK